MKYDEIIQEAAIAYMPEYDWRLWKAQLMAESNLNPQAVSPAGAYGIAQFMPETWAEWSKRAGYQSATPFDVEPAVNVGACYMAHLLKSWHSKREAIDRYCLAAASYNAGLGNLLKAQKAADMAVEYALIIGSLNAVTGTKSLETITYVRRILSTWIDLVTKG